MIYRFKAKLLRSALNRIDGGRNAIAVIIVVFLVLSCGKIVNANDSASSNSAVSEKPTGNTIVDKDKSAVADAYQPSEKPGQANKKAEPQSISDGKPAIADSNQSPANPAQSDIKSETTPKKKKSQSVAQPSIKDGPVKKTDLNQVQQKKLENTPPQPVGQKKTPGQMDPPAPNLKGAAQTQTNQNSRNEVKPAGPEGQSKPGIAQSQLSSGAMPNLPHPLPNQPQSTFQPPRPQQGKVTLNFDDADIYSVIQTVFGEILRVSYTVDPKVKGRVTFRAVAPVEIDKVLPLMEVIFRLNGIAIVEESGLNRIVPLSDIAREPVPVSFGRTIETVTGKSILKVVPIKNMQSAEMVKLLTPFSSEKAVIVNVPNTNQIIIVDTDSTVKRLIQLMEIFDTELQKPRGAKVYVHHIQNGSAREITALLHNLFLGASIADRSHQKVPTPSPQVPGMLPPKTGTAPGSSSSGPAVTRGMDAVLEQARIVADENANTVIVYATPEEYEAIKDAIEKIDVTPRQVLIEALILDVLLTDNLSLGVNAAYKTNDLRIGFNAASTPNTNDNVNSALSAVTKGLHILKLAGNSDLSLFITALAEKSKLKVLSAPHTIVSDSKEAEITIADTVQITSADIVGTTTVQNTVLYQQKDVGTILKVVPRIHEGGIVALKISQEVSQVAGDISHVKQGTLFHKTQVKNELVAMDGETIIIGGLIREDSTRSRNGIPFLSSIPLLGWLFGGTIDNVQRRELIILLTPRVIKNQKDASRITEEYINRLIQGTKTGVTKDDITKQLPVIKPKGPDMSQNRPDSKQQK